MAKDFNKDRAAWLVRSERAKAGVLSDDQLRAVVATFSKSLNPSNLGWASICRGELASRYVNRTPLPMAVLASDPGLTERFVSGT